LTGTDSWLELVIRHAQAAFDKDFVAFCPKSGKPDKIVDARHKPEKKNFIDALLRMVA